MSILHLPHVFATSLKNIFCQRPSKIFFVNVPQKYFCRHPSKIFFVDIPQKYCLSTSLKNIFCRHPSKIFFVNVPQKYFFCQHPSKIFYLATSLNIFQTTSLAIFGRREEAKQLMGAAQTKTNATQNEVNIIIIKIATGSPKLTSLQSWPLTKVDLSPKMTSFHRRWPRGSVRGYKTSTCGSLSWRRYSSWSWSWRDHFLMILALRLLET